MIASISEATSASRSWAGPPPGFGSVPSSASAGKALYNCVADVLDGMSRRISNAPDTTRALATAASQLRAAASKAQALSAISQCRAVVAGALRQALAMGQSGAGLNAVAGVLARAAQLIQTKG